MRLRQGSRGFVGACSVNKCGYFAREKGQKMNRTCRTGASPSWHCGAAFYCSAPYDCCAACELDCNMRCGWIGAPGSKQHTTEVSDHGDLENYSGSNYSPAPATA